jgi:hypothetical protein
MTQVADGTGEGAWEVCPPSSLTGLSAKHTCLFAAASVEMNLIWYLKLVQTRDNRHVLSCAYVLSIGCVLSLYILGPKVIGPFPHDMSPTPTSHQRPSWDAYVLHVAMRVRVAAIQLMIHVWMHVASSPKSCESSSMNVEREIPHDMGQMISCRWNGSARCDALWRRPIQCNIPMCSPRSRSNPWATERCNLRTHGISSSFAQTTAQQLTCFRQNVAIYERMAAAALRRRHHTSIV